MPYFKKCFKFILCLFLAINCVAAYALENDQATIMHVRVTKQDDQLYIDMKTALTLSDEVRKAAEKGVPLYFTYELQVYQPRWWFLDKLALHQTESWRISYNALTRQWWINPSNADDKAVPEFSLDDALDNVANLLNWPINHSEQLESGRNYYGELRLKLDTTLLPRPFQFNAFNSSAWSLSTEWLKFKIQSSSK